jgi:hypothetical protein
MGVFASDGFKLASGAPRRFFAATRQEVGLLPVAEVG